jgi:hypothetical protein
MGRPLEARVCVVASTGAFCAPQGALHKVGPGDPFFYSAGTFAVDVPLGQADVVVERGTEYRPLRRVVTMPSSGTVEVDLPLERWIAMAEQGWYAGNTHVHYDETETHATERLFLDPRVEDLPVLIVSVLQRRGLPYASNAFPPGRHPLSTDDHVLDVGEESRHNDTPWHIGLGHIMLINLKELVEPVSRGILVDDASPDYPPLVDACDATRAQGGVVLWCHNGNGMEAPIAAALGKLDGLNLFDPYWMDPEYDLWYRLLNCGVRLPASTGSDWFVCSSNRVYVEVDAGFSYPSWLARLREGRSFVTDGPILDLRVEDYRPSNDPLDVGHGVPVALAVEWHSAQPIERLEIVRDGEVATAIDNPDGKLHGRATLKVDASDAGWIAARCWGRRRTSFGHPLWAHTSPVYLSATPNRARRQAAAAFFVERIGAAQEWLATGARFANAAQRDRMLALFAEGRMFYERLTRT